MAGTAVRRGLTGRLAWRRATLVDRHPETDSAVSLTFSAPGWAGHLAGQHVDIRLTADDGYTADRTYSMAEPARGDAVTVTVQRVKDGEVSPYLVDQLPVGAQVEMRGPVGGWFVWDPADRGPVLLVAGGSGLVPLMAMVRSRRQARSPAAFRLIYSVRTPADVLYAAELRIPRVGDAGLETTLVYTREVPDGFPGPPRRVRASDLTARGWPPDFGPTCYVCGPNGFVEWVATGLVELGHDPAMIRTERFGPGGG